MAAFPEGRPGGSSWKVVLEVHPGMSAWKGILEGPGLEGTGLEGASLQGASLEGARLEGASLEVKSMGETGWELSVRGARAGNQHPNSGPGHPDGLGSEKTSKANPKMAIRGGGRRATTGAAKQI